MGIIANELQLVIRNRPNSKSFLFWLEITKNCYYCQKLVTNPNRLKLTLHDDSLELNHTIYCENLATAKVQVLHVVEEVTISQAARGLGNMTAQELLRALKACCIDFYLDPPDVITHDAGINFFLRDFQANADILHIQFWQTPTEDVNSISLVEQYHEPLHHAFHILKAETTIFYFQKFLFAAIKSINDSILPEVPVRTLIVFEKIPRFGKTQDPRHPDIAKRHATVENMTKVISTYFSKRCVLPTPTRRVTDQTQQLFLSHITVINLWCI